MNIIITEEQEENLKLYRIYELSKPYFEEKGYNNLKKIIKMDTVYYIDKDTRNILFYYNQDRKNGIVYIDYHTIWTLFKSYFSLQYTEIQEVMKYWLEDFYNLKGLTPQRIASSYAIALDEVYKYL
jgi:hypothetical protein